MAIAQFPSRYHADYPSDPSGQQHLILQDLPREWPSLTIKTFKDGGVTAGLQNTNYVQRWLLSYDGLTREEAAILDDHYNSAQSQFQSFSFRHSRSGILYTNVRYESYDYPTHQNIDAQARTVTLIKRPPQNDPGFLLLESGDNILLEAGGSLLRQN